MTRFRAGALVGFAAGYYLGAKAGRGRYEQLNRLMHRLRRSSAIDHAATAIEKAKAVVDLTKERVVDVTDHLDAPALLGLFR
jgi:hypothetical protein